MNKEDIKQLQMLEQSLHSILIQKQQFQGQLIEIESALAELDKTNTAYKIIGNIMVASNKPELRKDLEEKKQLFSARLKVLEKQEEKFRAEANKIQEQLMKGTKKE